MTTDESMKKEIKEEMEKIQTPHSLYEFAKNIKEESEVRVDFEQPTERKKSRRKFQFAAAAVVSLGVLTGSAFLNPTMAEMASKIPYLGQVFHKPIAEVIAETLEKEGYKTAGIGINMTAGEKPLVDIRLKGTEQYINQEEEKVLNILTGILDKRGYDNYELKVSDTNEVSPVLTEIVNQREMLGEKLKRDLLEAGYPIIDVNAFNPVVQVYIPIAEKAKVVEIQKVAIERLKANGTSKQVQVTTRDASVEELESEWMLTMMSIDEKFYLKKEYRVSDISYSYKPEKVTITVMTSMKPSDAVAKETVAKIRNEITEFLDSEEVKTKTENQKYELIVLDKNGHDFPF